MDRGVKSGPHSDQRGWTLFAVVQFKGRSLYRQTHIRRSAMNDPQIGWIAAIIVGGIAGWLAELFMKSQMGLVMNIVLGIIGAAVASGLFNMLGVSLGGGWVGYLIAGFIGACILIFAARAIRGATA